MIIFYIKRTVGVLSFGPSSWLLWWLRKVKNLPAVQEMWVQSLGWEDPLEKGMGTHPVFLPGESHGHRSLASYSP